MNAYTISGIIIVVTVVRLLWITAKKKDGTLSSEQVQTAFNEMDERRFESDDIPESSYADPLHWTIEQETRQAAEIESAPNSAGPSEELQQVVNKIIALPHDFSALRNKSQNQLVMESGYCGGHEHVTEKMIADALATQPRRTGEWLLFSENKRTPEGWFLINEAGRFFVGTFTTKGGYKKALTEYPDLEGACAAFIKREIEYSRKTIAAKRRRN